MKTLFSIVVAAALLVSCAQSPQVAEKVAPPVEQAVVAISPPQAVPQSVPQEPPATNSDPEPALSLDAETSKIWRDVWMNFFNETATLRSPLNQDLGLTEEKIKSLVWWYTVNTQTKIDMRLKDEGCYYSTKGFGEWLEKIDWKDADSVHSRFRVTEDGKIAAYIDKPNKQPIWLIFNPRDLNDERP